MFEIGDLVYIREHDSLSYEEQIIFPGYYEGVMSECGGEIYRVNYYDMENVVILEDLYGCDSPVSGFFWHVDWLRRADDKSYVSKR